MKASEHVAGAGNEAANGPPADEAAVTSRQGAILSLVQEQGFATIEGLAKRFDVSAQTIRRDIIRLDEVGLLQRFHGGAGLRSSTVRLGYERKQVVAASAKDRIGGAAAALVPDGGSLFLDVGTTAEAVARALLGGRGLTIVTPSLTAAAILAGSGVGEVVATGGVVRGPDGSLVGDETVAAIERFRLDWAVLACSGFDMDGSAMDFDVMKVGVKRAMMRRARRTMLVADSSKFARTALLRLAHLHEISTLVTDAPPPDGLGALIRDGGCRVVLAR